MGDETSLRIYIRGKFAKKREKNIKALAKKYFPKPSGEDGNVSAMFLGALTEKYNLDPETSQEKYILTEMVADAPRKPFPSDQKSSQRKKGG